MSVLRFVSGTMLAACAMSAAPASAQFFFQSRDLAGKPVRGDEPGIISMPMPGATPEELQAGLVWTMRAALNVAALQCQFEPSFNTVRNYNALLLDHKDELQGSFDTLGKYFKRTSKTAAEGQSRLDQFGTRTYSSFATVAAQFGFCQTANRISREANFAPRGHFGEFAQEHMQELRNSLEPFGEQRFPAYYNFQLASVPTPRFDKVCWSKKGVWQAKKCGAFDWPPVGTGLAAR